MKKICKIFVMSGMFLMLYLPCLSSAISSFAPTWYIGDSWSISLYQRDISFLKAAKVMRNPDYGEFMEPSVYTFRVVDKKELDGEECFVVEIEGKMANKILLYYTVNGVNLKYIEELRKSDGARIADTSIFEKGLQIESYISRNIPLTWPDFSNLDPLNSPQTIMEGGRPVRQEVTVNGDILTVIWKMGYKEEDGSYSGAIKQEWKTGEKWWSKSEYIRGSDGRIIEKAELGIGVATIKAQVVIEPETFNKNTGIFTAFVSFSEDYDASTITDAECDGAPAYDMSYNKGKKEMILKFRRNQVAEEPLDTNFTVTGHLRTGGTFEGNDQIFKIVE